MGQEPFRKTLQRGDGETGEKVSSSRLSLALHVLAWPDGMIEEPLLECPCEVGKGHRVDQFLIPGPRILEFDFL